MFREPKLIVTCKTGSEDLCIHEVCNVLFIKDPDVKAEKSKYSGLIFIYTNLEVDRAYKSTSHREYGFVENIIPVHCAIEYPVNPAEVKACLEKLPTRGPVKLRIRSRGVRGASIGLFAMFSELLRSVGTRHEPSSKDCLFVEVVEKKVYIGFGDCHSIYKATIRIGE